MGDDARGYLIRQLDTAWELTSYHLEGLPTGECLTWQLGFWWSMALDHSFGPRTLTREAVRWPGSADGVGEWIGRLHREWREALEPLTDDDLRSTARTRWPFQDRPFGDVVAWATVELTKNAAEIGSARFLHAVTARTAGD